MLVGDRSYYFLHLTKADHQAIPHNCGQLAGRASHRDLVPRWHDQRRLALLVHTAEPTCVGKQLTLLPVTDAGGLTYLHRHTAALGKGRHHRELQSVFVFAFFSLAAPKHLNEPAGMARETIGLP